jgi:hypothetical protein
MPENEFEKIIKACADRHPKPDPLKDLSLLLPARVGTMDLLRHLFIGEPLPKSPLREAEDKRDEAISRCVKDEVYRPLHQAEAELIRKEKAELAQEQIAKPRNSPLQGTKDGSTEVTGAKGSTLIPRHVPPQSLIPNRK